MAKFSRSRKSSTRKLNKRRPMKGRSRRRARRKGVFSNTNQTIKWRCATADSPYREWHPMTSVNNALHASFPFNPTTLSTMNKLLDTDGRVLSMFARFRYFRISGIKVQLIPEQWTAAVNVSTAGGVIDGEKPRLHWIQDTGQIEASKTISQPLSIPEAQSYSGYRSAQFTKPFYFNIKPLYKTSGTGTTKSDGWISGNMWRSTANVQSGLADAIPFANLHYGVTQIPGVSGAELKYKAIIDFQFVFKEPFVV